LPTEIRNLTNLEVLILIRNNLSEAEKEKIEELLPKCIVIFYT
jgi:Leucine-rich repeat (LRR) protein